MNMSFLKQVYYTKIKNSVFERLVPNKIMQILKYFFFDKGYQKAKRPCHFRELFIQSSGDIYPCCQVWNRKDLLIGNIKDNDILTKIKAFSPSYCACDKGAIRKIAPEDTPGYDHLNVEFSLACHAKCAMCCVDAPNWKGNYNLYDAIRNLIKSLGPFRILSFQGGEVLIQEKALLLIEDLKSNHCTDSWFHIVSNGNVDIKLIHRLNSFLDSITISIVGFQRETYKSIMGIDLEKTKEFVENLLLSSKIQVSLKFLVTPLNIHEISAFLNWALKITPHSIQIVETTGFDSYIKNTKDNFWEKIIDRSIKDINGVLLSCDRSVLRSKGTEIHFQNFEKFHIDKEFINSNNLKGIVF